MFAKTIVVLSIAAVAWTAPAETQDCNARQIADNKMVCVCSKSGCDTVNITWPTNKGQAIQVESSRSGKRLHVTNLGKRQQRDPNDPQSAIHVKPDEKYQTIMGWGGAFTDSTALNVYNLSKTMSQKLIESYYGADGLLYNFGRVPMGGADFSSRVYTYDDVADDYDLKHWALATEDTDFKIPMIKEAISLCEKRNEHLKLFGSPWSPPVWMKDNNKIAKGHLKNDERIYQSYSNYLIKFYQAYKEHGVEFWGQTLENEPVYATYPDETLNSLEFNATEQIRFVTKYFGPALEANGMTKDKFKLMVGDDSTTKLLPLVADVLGDPNAGKYFAGLAFHWYDSDHGAASGAGVPYDLLQTVYDKVKDKIEFSLMTEACWQGIDWNTKQVDLGNWDHADAYAYDITEDLLRFTSGWIDWNMALNKAGGPNWINNFVNSPIIVDEVNDEFLKQPMYYALGHFSRFFRPGSVRVGTTIDTKEDIVTVAVRDDSSGHIIVNILNRSDKDQQVSLDIEAGQKQRLAPVALEPKSLNTIIVKV